MLTDGDQRMKIENQSEMKTTCLELLPNFGHCQYLFLTTTLALTELRYDEGERSRR